MTNMGRVLTVDDDQGTCELIEATLAAQGFDVSWHTRAEPALEAVAHGDYDVVLTDLELDGMDGLDLCAMVHTMDPSLPVVLVTGHGSMESAVAAIRVGAYDFITKPLDAKLLSLTAARAVEHRRLEQQVKRLQEEVEHARGFERLLGSSAAMRRIYDLIARVAPTDASVLITGESGTGKELVARAIHQRSARAEEAFVAVNCAAIPPSLVESELFGHVAGAFTGARGNHEGLFVQATGGTLFLDEIGELPVEMQPKLLRALQEGVVRPVGGSGEVAFDARIVSATNFDLEDPSAREGFREDLYYRINVVTLQVPPLRERRGDVLELAQHFIERFARRHGKGVTGMTPATADKLLAYPWPGNVRELENAVERAVTLSPYALLAVSDLPERVRLHRADRLTLDAQEPSQLLPLAELERRYVRRVLSLMNGNKARAARVLGINRRTLYRKLERFETEASHD